MDTIKKNGCRMDIERIRADTPCGNIYMNHASTSVPPLPVIQAAGRYYDIIMRYGATSARAEELTQKAYDLALKRTAGLIHAKPSEIAFMPNGSMGIGLIALGIPWERGQNIILDEMSFISNAAPWFQIRDLYGVEIRYAPAKLPGRIDCQALESLIDLNTALIAVTHSANSLGVLQDVEAAGQIAKEKGVRYLVDASGTIGAVEIDVTKLSCDYLAAAGRKYLRGPSGSGILYVRESSQPELRGSIPAWNSGVWDYRQGTFSYHRDMQKWNYGEKDYPAIFGLSEAVKYLEDIGGAVCVKDRINLLAGRLIRQLQTIPGLQIIGPEEAEKRAGVVGVCMEGKSIREIALYLNSHNVGMMGHHFFCPGIQKLFQIEGVARLSLHYWNTEEEIDYVADLLMRLQKGV